MKFRSFICLVVVTTSTLAQEQCAGKRNLKLRNACVSCSCKNEANNIRWDCTRCGKSRHVRDVSIATDLKKTPCAASDQLHIDCNTCYCNSAGSGYLCTQRSCPPGSTAADFTTPKPANATEEAEIGPNSDLDYLLVESTSLPILSEVVEEDINNLTTAEIDTTTEITNINITTEEITATIDKITVITDGTTATANETTAPTDETTPTTDETTAATDVTTATTDNATPTTIENFSETASFHEETTKTNVESQTTESSISN